ncbi:MAG: hypothetical protein EOP04_06460 [Proteobacteria bacterium]|nr:MAG: hypothetical protein EOP04_06460 [Pseudomonadota bacterium]
MKTKIVPNGTGERRNILGDNQTIKLSSEDTNGAFIMFEQSNDPGVGVPLHVHENDDELFYIIARCWI